MSATVRSPCDIALPAAALNRDTRANAAEREIMNSPKRLARIAGLLYLFVGIFGGFAEGFLDRGCMLPRRGADGWERFSERRSCRLGVVAHLLDGAFIAHVFFGLW